MNLCGYPLKRWAGTFVLVCPLLAPLAGTPTIVPPDTTLLDDRKPKTKWGIWDPVSKRGGKPPLQFQRLRSVTLLTNPPAGIGAVIAEVPRGFVVKRVVAGTPASRAGMREGDVIVAINGKPAAKFELSDAAVQIRGQIGSLVDLTLCRAGVDQPLRIKLYREVLPAPPAFIRDDD